MLYICRKCGNTWRYPIEKCIFCKQEIVMVESMEFTVKGKTEVFIPTIGNTKVPYYNLLLEDEMGNHSLIKSFKDHALGSSIKTEDTSSNTISIGIIGSGIMGTGIAQLLAESGFNVLFGGRTKKSLDRSVGKIERNLSKNYDLNEKNTILNRITPVVNFDLFSDVDLIIESITEDKIAKKTLFAKLAKICKSEAIIATNTSSFSVSELANNLNNPANFIGMHFFNPAYKMNLVEVVFGSKTSQDTIDFTMNLAIMLGKTPIKVKDSPGFIVNRILMPYLNEAIALLDEDVSDVKSIDTAITLGLNNPVGPLKLADFIGLDVCLAIMNTLHLELKEKRLEPHPLLIQMVSDGKLGIKTGEGFYKYE